MRNLGLLSCLFVFYAQATPVVEIKTTAGNIVVELNEQKAPKTVDNFLQYVNEDFYDGTIFHRVIKNFMIQGGGYDSQYQKKATHAPIASETQNGLENVRGSIAMARTNDPHSATSQFFINHVDNDFLNPGGADTHGYTVFGQVTQGMDVVDKIANIPTEAAGPFSRDVPTTPVIIESINIVEQTDGDDATENQQTESE